MEVVGEKCACESRESRESETEQYLKNKELKDAKKLCRAEGSAELGDPFL